MAALSGSGVPQAFSLELRSEVTFEDEESRELFLADGSGKAETTVDDALKEVRDMAKRETRGVRFWKLVVLVIMVIIAALVSAGTYVFLRAEEDDDYIESYFLFAKSMQTAIEEHANKIFLAMRSCSNIVSSDAEARGSTFPFHTVANFEVIGEAIRKQSGLELFAHVPFVDGADALQWYQYSVANQGWVEKSRQTAIDSGEVNVVTEYKEGGISPVIYDFGGPNETARMVPPGAKPFTPVWQISPPPFDPRTVNFNFRFYEFLETAIGVMERTRRGHFTRILASGEIGRLAQTGVSQDDHDSFHKQFVDWDESKGDAFLNPHGAYVEPVFNKTYDRDSKITGYLVAFVPWDAYIANLLPDGVEGIMVVVENSCGQAATYEVRGKRALFLDRSDMHDPRYDSTEIIVSFDVLGLLQADAVEDECVHTFHIYSSASFEESYRTRTPELLTAVVASAFTFLIFSFFVYDWFVNRRNRKVLGMAARSSEIVSNLFPRAVRDRFLAERETQAKGNGNSSRAMFRGGAADERLQQFLSEAGGDEDGTISRDDFMYNSRPIADLYPETTIMFADVAGFTAWSSTREPTQVFTLLETLYSAFDEIATRRKVFKVETIGDCYVAVMGIPEPADDHAVVMCRFAHECLRKMYSLTRKLEAILGPDTADLDMRFGLHSGSTTAGVLRGERSRFQLFGDTVNTASRMESTGERGKIQVSQETADLLMAAGKGHWLKQREEKVFAKGKGEMVSYWVKPSSRRNKRAGSDMRSELTSEHSSRTLGMNWDSDSEMQDFDHRNESSEMMEGSPSTDSLLRDSLRNSMTRLVQWNVENLLKFLMQIEVWRNARPTQTPPPEEGLWRISDTIRSGDTLQSGERVDFSLDDNMDVVSAELEDFVFTVATLYQEHSFHNFSHASNVAMSVEKLLSSLAPHGNIYGSTSSLPAFDPSGSITGSMHHHGGPANKLHADPLSRLACVMAAIVHAVAHPGVPNSVLMAEESRGTQGYKRKSTSEHISFERSWELLQERRFENLRNAIFRDPMEEARFREELRLCVISTDLMDAESSRARQKRWENTFESPPTVEESAQDWDKRAALVLMEHIVRASSVVHAMQHWEVYTKWSGRLYDEYHTAFAAGRDPDNPAEHWHQREMCLFDELVVPLAKRLCQSGAFHKATIETYLTYAERNRQQWQTQGQELVVDMTKSAILAKIRSTKN